MVTIEVIRERINKLYTESGTTIYRNFTFNKIFTNSNNHEAFQFNIPNHKNPTRKNRKSITLTSLVDLINSNGELNDDDILKILNIKPRSKDCRLGVTKFLIEQLKR